MRLPRTAFGYVLGVTVIAAILLARADLTPPGTPRFWDTLAALAALALLAELFSLQLRVGTATSAVSFVPYLAAIQLVGPSWAMVIAGFTELFAEAVIRRKPLVKLIHNTSKEMVSVYLAGYFYLLTGGHPSTATFDIHVPGFVGATFIYFLISNGATATAIALSTRSEMSEAWSQIVGKGLAQDLLSSSLAPLLAFLWIQTPWALLLVAVPLFLVRHALRVNLQVEQANRELLELMVKSIEARDTYTSGHSLRVARYAKAIARSLGLPARELEQIETAALLHDVGKIYEEFAPILRKEARLTGVEMELIRTHPIRSAELVRTISGLRGYVERCVRAHHENYDGSGYPDGLAGEEIPIGSRIIMVADTADAMMTDRPYRLALDYDSVVRELERCSGTQFDPVVVDAFRRSTAIRHILEERQRVQAEAVGAGPERLRSLAVH